LRAGAVATGVMIHVGGSYSDLSGNTHITGSLGCFGLSGSDQGNQGIERFVDDVTNRVAANKRENKGQTIHLTIEKRDDVDWEWEVDPDGSETSWIEDAVD